MVKHARLMTQTVVVTKQIQMVILLELVNKQDQHQKTLLLLLILLIIGVILLPGIQHVLRQKRISF